MIFKITQQLNTASAHSVQAAFFMQSLQANCRLDGFMTDMLYAKTDLTDDHVDRRNTRSLLEKSASFSAWKLEIELV